MTLSITDASGAIRLVSNESAPGDVYPTVMGESWEDLTFVTLERHESHSMTLSGSLIDGFALVLHAGGKQWTAPVARPAAGVPALVSYVRGDDRWHGLAAWE